MKINPITVDNVDITDTVISVIESTQNEQTSDAIWLKENVSYTFTSTTLNQDELFNADIYDFANNAWQPYYYDGTRVKLSHNYEQIVISGVSCLIRFVKTATESDVGLVMTHR